MAIKAEFCLNLIKVERNWKADSKRKEIQEKKEMVVE